MSWFEQLREWQVDEVLRKHPGLTVEPAARVALQITGHLRFVASAPGLEEISDDYQIAISITEGFPKVVPKVRETGGRIDPKYHALDGGNMCLGSPAQLRIALALAPTLPAFIEKCIIPYLYGYTYFERHGRVPFGELAHGDKGLIDDYKQLFGVKTIAACVGMLLLIGMKRRVANKRPCPCGSDLRVGRCHNRTVNRLRRLLGRAWCRGEAAWIAQEYLESTGRAQAQQAVRQAISPKHAPETEAANQRRRSEKKPRTHDAEPQLPATGSEIAA